MLILSRRKDESITIGDHIEVFVVEIRGDKVRLGVRAPTETPVHRREVLDAILASGGNLLIRPKNNSLRPSERAMKENL